MPDRLVEATQVEGGSVGRGAVAVGRVAPTVVVGAAADLAQAPPHGVTGTPAFIIQTPTGAKQLVGAQPADAFFKAIDSMMKK